MPTLLPPLWRSAPRAPRLTVSSAPSPPPNRKAKSKTVNAMGIITIEKAGEHEDQEVTLRGWLYNLRESGKLLFPIFRDGTGLIQGVVSQKEQPDAFAALRGLTQESSVEITGKIRREPRAPGGYEIRSEERRVGKECRSRWSADQ